MSLKTKQQEEVMNAAQDRHPSLYSNLEQLLDQRQRIAKSILTPSGLWSEQDRQKALFEFDRVQNLIRKYVGV